MNTYTLLSAIWTALKLGAVIYMGISLIQYWAERCAKKEQRDKQITDAIRSIQNAESKIKSLEEKNDRLSKEFEQLSKSYLRMKGGK